jgi:hypothetical protein
MSYSISNFCPSSFKYLTNHIPSDIEVLNIDEVHIPYGEVFGIIPDNIKEVNINKNIYTDKNRALIREDMTKDELKSLIKILFPHNRRGVKYYIDNKIHG